MFTEKEKKMIKYVIGQKLELAKEVTKRVTSAYRTECKETEYILQSILQKIG